MSEQEFQDSVKVCFTDQIPEIAEGVLSTKCNGVHMGLHIVIGSRVDTWYNEEFQAMKLNNYLHNVVGKDFNKREIANDLVREEITDIVMRIVFNQITREIRQENRV